MDAANGRQRRGLASKRSDVYSWSIRRLFLGGSEAGDLSIVQPVEATVSVRLAFARSLGSEFESPPGE
jgi:hypothetical protein